MGKYFVNISTLEELRNQYKELLKLHHPDNGGDLEIMQEINAEYDHLFKLLKDQHENDFGDSSTKSNYKHMKYDFAEDGKLRDMLYADWMIHQFIFTMKVLSRSDLNLGIPTGHDVRNALTTFILGGAQKHM